jgi:PiT family inorganic phosphate transporter
VVAVLVALASAFDFMHGFHAAASSIATVVSTGVLKPHHAVLRVASFNFIALFVFQLKAASPIAAAAGYLGEAIF